MSKKHGLQDHIVGLNQKITLIKTKARNIRIPWKAGGEEFRKELESIKNLIDETIKHSEYINN